MEIPESPSPSSAGMSTAIIGDSMTIAPSPHGPANIEVDFVKCDCCGFSEECTESYIETIRQRYGGKWICGLCAEAVKDEALRCQKLITADEAMARHLSFCNKFRAPGAQQDPAVHLIRAMRQVLKKSLDGTKSSMPNSPKKSTKQVVRSQSCLDPRVVCPV